MVVIRKRNLPRIQRVWKALSEQERSRGTDQDAVLGRERTARRHAIVKLGKKFLETFPIQEVAYGEYLITVRPSVHESPVSITLERKKNNYHHTIGNIKLGFTVSSVIVEAIHGARGAREMAERVREVFGASWGHYLLRIIETHAKRMGFSHVKIRKAETLHWYRDPNHDVENPQEAADIRARMKKKYDDTAKGGKYQSDGEFWTKKL